MKYDVVKNALFMIKCENGARTLNSPVIIHT